MLNDEQLKRFKALQNKWCDQKLLDELYGIRLPDEALLGSFRSWANQRLREKIVEKQNHQFNRHALELFFLFHKLLPVKWAAARLGMEKESFEEFLKVLDESALFIKNGRNFTDQLIDEIFIREIHRLFPELSNKVFENHDVYCMNLHQSVKNSFNVDVKACYCVTSKILDTTQPDYAYEFDVITLEPIGIRYNIWLDFGKPVSLSPDKCSFKLYLMAKDTLASYIISSSEIKLSDVETDKLKIALL